jgi:hypothetical protein
MSISRAKEVICELFNQEKGHDTDNNYSICLHVVDVVSVSRLITVILAEIVAAM